MKSLVYLILPVLFLLPFYSEAQQSPRQADIITLNDGSEIKGFVTKKEDNGDVQFLMLGDYPIHLESKHIKSIEKGSKHVLYFNDGRSINTAGYYAVYKISSTWTRNGDVDGTFSGMHFHTTHGYQFTDLLSVGGGIGLDITGGADLRTYTFLPLYLDIRGYPFRKKVSPYYALGIGYGFGFDLFNNFVEEDDESYTGGYMIAPALGLRFASKKKGDFMLEVGYKIQKSDSQYQDYTWDRSGGYSVHVQRNSVFRRMEISFGWIF